MDNKNIGTEDRVSLKEEDMLKSGVDTLDTVPDELEAPAKGKVRGEQAPTEKKKKRKVPLVLDIFLAIIIIALAVALVIGVYSVFKYYTLGYKEVTLEYSLVIESDRIDDSIILPLLKGEDIYLDIDGKTLYLGEIDSIGRNSKGQVEIVATVDAKYKNGEGYSVEEQRIAVGSEYTLRVEDNKPFAASVVELRELGGNE